MTHISRDVLETNIGAVNKQNYSGSFGMWTQRKKHSTSLRHKDISCFLYRHGVRLGTDRLRRKSNTASNAKNRTIAKTANYMALHRTLAVKQSAYCCDLL